MGSYESRTVGRSKVGKRKKNKRKRTETEQPTGPKISVLLPPVSTNSTIGVLFFPEFDVTDAQASLIRTPEGAPGFYKVTFILGIPGEATATRAVNINKLMNSGDSLLEVPHLKEVRVTVEDDRTNATVRFFRNRHGRLARVEMRFLALNRRSAEQSAYDLVHPILSWWSYLHDVAIDTIGYEILEESTEIRSFHFNVIGSIKPFRLDHLSVSTPEHRAILSAYREALNATNVFYRFLCFYRVIEGIRKLREKRRRAALEAGEHYRDPGERIPTELSNISDFGSDELERFYPYLGKKFTAVIDELRPVIRNAVAHLNPNESPLVIDRFDDVLRCREILPVMRYMCREMLRTELSPLLVSGSENGASESLAP